MNKKYLKFERSDISGSYTVDRKQLDGCIDGEFDDLQFLEVGTRFTLTVIEMDEDKFGSLPEFMGW